jgi:hypothetical protein
MKQWLTAGAGTWQQLACRQQQQQQMQREPARCHARVASNSSGKQLWQVCLAQRAAAGSGIA